MLEKSRSQETWICFRLYCKNDRRLTEWSSLFAGFSRCLNSQLFPDFTGEYRSDIVDLSLLIAEEVSTLFRGTSLTTTLMDQYMKMVAIPYLQKTIGDVVAKIVECKQSCEVWLVS